MQLFFRRLMFVIRVPTKQSHIWFGSSDNSFLARWNERVLIMHLYAEFIEMKQKW